MIDEDVILVMNGCAVRFAPDRNAMQFLECREAFFQKLDGGMSYRHVGYSMMVKCWEVV